VSSPLSFSPPHKLALLPLSKKIKERERGRKKRRGKKQEKHNKQKKDPHTDPVFMSVDYAFLVVLLAEPCKKLPNSERS